MPICSQTSWCRNQLTLFPETPACVLTEDGWAAGRTHSGPGLTVKEHEPVARNIAAAFVNCMVLSELGRTFPNM